MVELKIAITAIRSPATPNGGVIPEAPVGRPSGVDTPRRRRLDSRCSVRQYARRMKWGAIGRRCRVCARHWKIGLLGALMLVVSLLPAQPASAVYKGLPAQLSQFPWLVTLTVSGKENCGGALIADRVILTAAHCLAGSLRTSTRVVFGFHTRETAVADITGVSEHGYIPAESLNDLAVVHINRQPISARAISLTATDPPIGASVTAIGFGCSSAPYLAGIGHCTSLPKHLQRVTLTRVRQDCRDLSTTDFCTEGDWASTNHGDSGGPVMLLQHMHWLLAGLVDLDASGTPTDDTPPYFEDMTSIARELPWINTVIHTGARPGSDTVSRNRFGGMSNPGSLQRATRIFGRPTTAFADSSPVDCDVRWDDLGIRALFQDFGAPSGQCQPQSQFNLSMVTLSGPRWVTAAGLRLGDSVAALRRDYPQAPSPADCSVDTPLPPSSFRLGRVPDPLGGPGSYICTLAAVVSHGVVTEFVLSSAAASE